MSCEILRQNFTWCMKFYAIIYYGIIKTIIFAENLFLALSLLTTILFLCMKKVKMDNKMIFLFCFCMVVLLLIGYTTPNAGAICRYKSVILPIWTYILLAPLTNMRKEQQEGIAGNGETGE